jgi:hypothetical protein
MVRGIASAASQGSSRGRVSSPFSYRLKADALAIEHQAAIRLADEYDAAQARGEIQKHGGQGKRDIPTENIPSQAQAGLTPKVVHEARQIRDAEQADPGIVKRTLDEQLERGEEPTGGPMKYAN